MSVAEVRHQVKSIIAHGNSLLLIVVCAVVIAAGSRGYREGHIAGHSVRANSGGVLHSEDVGIHNPSVDDNEFYLGIKFIFFRACEYVLCAGRIGQSTQACCEHDLRAFGKKHSIGGLSKRDVIVEGGGFSVLNSLNHQFNSNAFRWRVPGICDHEFCNNRISRLSVGAFVGLHEYPSALLLPSLSLHGGELQVKNDERDCADHKSSQSQIERPTGPLLIGVLELGVGIVLMGIGLHRICFGDSEARIRVGFFSLMLGFVFTFHGAIPILLYATER